MIFGYSYYKIIFLCFMVGVAGFVDSIAGGGGLISLPAYLIVGFPPVVASGTNKIAAFMGASVSFGKYAKAGYVKFKIAIPCCIIAVISSSIGAMIQTKIPTDILRMFMIIALPITLIIILNKKMVEQDENIVKVYTGKDWIALILISIALGIYDGLYGPGTGTMLIMLFVNVMKINIKEANGLAKAINWSTNVGAMLYFIYDDKPIILLGIIAGCCSMIGSYIGSNLFTKKGSKIAKPIMIIVIVILLIKVLVEYLIK